MKSCTLEDLKAMRLLKRFEYKYVISLEVAEKLLENLASQDIIRVLEVKNQRIVHYSSDYYDTPDYTCFKEHHAKQLNRYKVRTRHYSTGDLVWQEEKWRTNRNQVVKIRVPIEEGQLPNWNVLREQSTRPELYQRLEKSLTVDYDRITVVDKDLKEKMTLDFNLVQQTSERSIQFNDLVVVEVKQPSKSFRQTFNKAMREIGARTTGMSKYCIGLSYLHHQMKSNLFKPQLLYLQKHFNPKITTV